MSQALSFFPSVGARSAACAVVVCLTLAGFLFFQEHPEPTLLLGMVIVVAATFYTIRANARLAAERAAAEAATAN